LNEYLHELRERTFEPHHAFSVGETPGVGMEMSKMLTGDYRKELDMVFCFDHLDTPGHTRFDDYRYDLNYLKKFLVDWQMNYPNYCWMSLFYENHDNPRMVSKVNPDPAVRSVLAKLLGAIQLTLKGTPFIFQGQEIGMVNQKFASIDDMQDVESINLYHELMDGGMSSHDAFAKVLAGSRDHARTPVQWDASAFGGFSGSAGSDGSGVSDGSAAVKPWLVGDDDYLTCNVAAELDDPDSVLAFYKAAIALRHEFSSALVYGRAEFILQKEKDYFAYYRTDGVGGAGSGATKFFVECNLSEHSLSRNVRMPRISEQYSLVLSNYADAVEQADLLRPYEVRIYRVL
jgi:oligo-1,6-glucosidase